MGRNIGGVALLLLALFMAVGYAQADIDASAVTTLLTLLITVALPAAGGIALLRGGLSAPGRIAGRKEELRRKTLESELLRLATTHQGKLTVVEVVSALALPAGEAKEVLDGMVTREMADVEISDSGMLVYSFHDVRHLGEKETARGVLDA